MDDRSGVAARGCLKCRPKSSAEEEPDRMQSCCRRRKLSRCHLWIQNVNRTG